MWSLDENMEIYLNLPILEAKHNLDLLSPAKYNIAASHMGSREVENIQTNLGMLA